MSSGYRICNCTGYLTNPGGRCCMDLQSPSIVTEPKVSGWVCSKCGASNAPWVAQCPCS